MKLPALLIFSLVVAMLGATVSPATPLDSAAHDRTLAAYALGMGRLPNTQEASNPKSLGDQLGQIRDHLQADSTARKTMRTRAEKYAFGPARDKASSTNESNQIFAEVVKEHVQALSQNESAYHAVLTRAYQHVVGRDVYQEEIEYWAGHPTLPYALLVGCIEDWARRNQPGLMNTAGTPAVSINCELLETARLSPEIAKEASEEIALQNDSTVIAPGGGNLKSVGEIRFLVINAR